MLNNNMRCYEIQIGETNTFGFGGVGNNPIRLLMSFANDTDTCQETRRRYLSASIFVASIHTKVFIILFLRFFRGSFSLPNTTCALIASSLKHANV